MTRSNPSTQSIRQVEVQSTPEDELASLESNEARSERQNFLLTLLTSHEPQAVLLRKAALLPDDHPYPQSFGRDLKSAPPHLDAICSALQCPPRLVLQDLQDLALDLARPPPQHLNPTATTTTHTSDESSGRRHNTLGHGQMYIITK